MVQPFPKAKLKTKTSPQAQKDVMTRNASNNLKKLLKYIQNKVVQVN